MKKEVRTYAFDGIDKLNCQVWLPENMEGDPVLAPLVKHIPWRIFHGVTHNCWDKSYLETDLIDWLLAKENS